MGFEKAKRWDGESGQTLFEWGYKAITREPGMVARVDLEDREIKHFFMKLKLAAMVSRMPINQLRDYYRGVYSQATMVNVPQVVLLELAILHREHSNGPPSVEQAGTTEVLEK